MELTLSNTTRLSPRTSRDYSAVRAAIRGDQRAYAALLERYRTPVYNHLLKMVRNPVEAEDLTMEAFGKAFHKLSTYAPTYAFSTWLFKIATNNCIDHIRKKRLHLLSIDQTFEPHGDTTYAASVRATSLNPEEAVIHSQKLQMVRDTLPHLSDKYRNMIRLRYYDELSYDEIARELAIPLGTVKAQLFRAKEMLYGLMQQPHAAAYLDTTRRAN